MDRKEAIEKRIQAFARLGDYMRNPGSDPEFGEIRRKAQAANGFFTPENIERAVLAWGRLLTEPNLRAWMQPYAGCLPECPKNIGIVMAGNIPIVGFHDYLCVLLCGHTAQIKLSSKDPFLLPFFHRKLAGTVPEGSGLAFAEPSRVRFTEKGLGNFDAVIATGSGNTFRYFDYYFGKYPHVLRKNRTSCAVLTGKESKRDLEKLGDDIFAYFGLGCRNVSKLYIPENYDLRMLAEILAPISERAALNHMYRDNYDYHKSIYLVNRQPHTDTGAALLTESTALASPMSVIYYERYADPDRLAHLLAERRDEIQCVVGEGYLPFGTAQSPGLSDYADGVDVPAFLCRIG